MAGTRILLLALLAALTHPIPLDARPGLTGGSSAADSDLFGQAAGAALQRDFPSERVEYLLMDVPARRAIAIRWSRPGRAVPVGSLLKPFVALAYGASGRPFPAFRCRGKVDGCWRAEGHGELGLERALAESCNAYFLALGRGTDAAELSRVSDAYGLPMPPVESAPGTMIGFTPEWRVAPEALAAAYARLVSDEAGSDAVRQRLLAGMRMAALPGGTAGLIAARLRTTGTGVAVLAKTGTASCVADCIASGDGLAVAIWPAEQPRLLLLVRKRGTTGAQAADVAGAMIGMLEHMHGGSR